jgi:hypothetical protein
VKGGDVIDDLKGCKGGSWEKGGHIGWDSIMDLLYHVGKSGNLSLHCLDFFGIRDNTCENFLKLIVELFIIGFH